MGLLPDEMRQSAEQAFQRAMEQLSLGDLEGARASLAVAVMLYAQLEEKQPALLAGTYLADILCELGLMEEARLNYEAGLRLLSELEAEQGLRQSKLFASIHLKLANLELSQGRWELARHHLEVAERTIGEEGLEELAEIAWETRQDLEASQAGRGETPAGEGG